MQDGLKKKLAIANDALSGNKGLSKICRIMSEHLNIP